MKNAVVRAAETDTLMINQHNGRPVRVLRTKTTETFEGATSGDPMALLGIRCGCIRTATSTERCRKCGQVAGRIDEVLPAREIIARTVAEFEQTLGTLSTRYLDR